MLRVGNEKAIEEVKGHTFNLIGKDSAWTFLTEG